MKRVMIDIETLGVKNDAVVLSIAALGFKFCGIDEVGPRASWIAPEGYVWYPSLREQFARGRSVSEGTLEWWQRDELAGARADWAYLDGVKCEEMIESVYQSLAQVVENADEVWADGIVFDIGILESLFSPLPPPWKSYNVARDLRTVRNLLPVKRFHTGPPLVGFAHDPLYDCKHQIETLWSLWPEEPKENAKLFRPELFERAVAESPEPSVDRL